MSEESVEAAAEEPVDAPADPDVDVEEAAGEASASEASLELPRILKTPAGHGESVRRLFDPPARIVKREVLRSVHDVQQRLEDARAEADAIVASARTEAEQIREQARQEGFEQGYGELLEHMARAKKEYARVQDAAEEDMLELAFRIAGRIVGEAVELDDAVMARIVAENLEHVRGKRQIVVYVHPDDVEPLEVHKEDIVRRLDGASVWFEEDADIARGGCVVETETGRVDARLEARLDVLREAIQGGDES